MLDHSWMSYFGIGIVQFKLTQIILNPRGASGTVVPTAMLRPIPTHHLHLHARPVFGIQGDMDLGVTIRRVGTPVLLDHASISHWKESSTNVGSGNPGPVSTEVAVAAIAGNCGQLEVVRLLLGLAFFLHRLRFPGRAGNCAHDRPTGLGVHHVRVCWWRFGICQRQRSVSYPGKGRMMR